jgi:CRISPR/Cas system-associated exonuclease Cas4 (RecB family)
MSDLILSASSISTYLKCKKMYLYSNVYRVSGGQNLAAALGTAVHAAVETLWKSPKRPETALERSFERELALVPLPYEEPPETVLADAKRMYINYVQKVVPTFKPTLVEEKFVIEVEGISISGTLDAADEDVHDLKTTSMISKFRPDSYNLQLNLYRLGYKALTGGWPRRLLLDVLPRRGNFTYKQYEVPVETRDTLDVLGIVSQGIMAEDYSPTGATNGACRWCSYQEICPDALIT